MEVIHYHLLFWLYEKNTANENRLNYHDNFFAKSISKEIYSSLNDYSNILKSVGFKIEN